MSDFLDRVRADLDEATPGPWRWRNTEEPLLVGARSRIVMAFSRMGTQGAQPEFRDADGLLTKAGKANLYSYPDASLIASAPDRLDRMERALRGAMETHRPEPQEVTTVDGFDRIMFCRECGLEWGDDGCPTVEAIKEELGDE